MITASNPNTRRAGPIAGSKLARTPRNTPEMATIAIAALMALVLIVRPQGLFGARA